MKISKKDLKSIIAEEIHNILEIHGEPEEEPQEEYDPEEETQDVGLTGHDEEKVNLILNKLDHMGVKIPDVVGLEAEQLAGVIAQAIENWQKGKQLSPTGKSNLGTGLPRDPGTPGPSIVKFE